MHTLLKIHSDPELEPLQGAFGSGRVVARPRSNGTSSMIRSKLDADQLLTLIDDVGIVMVVLGLQGHVIKMNAAAEEATGWTAAEAEGVDWFETFVPEERRVALRNACFGRAGSEKFNANSSSLLHRDGGERYFDWFCCDLRTEEGMHRGVLFVGRDITDMRKAREDLLAAQERNRGILETAVNAIITISEYGIIESVNPATERMFGYKAEEMIGQNIKMLMPGPYRDQHDGYMERYRRTGERKIIGIGREVLAQRKDGSVMPVDLSVGEVILPTGRIFTGIIRDITDRKMLEQEMIEISEKEQQRIGQDIHDDLCQQLAAISCLAQVVQQKLKKGGLAEDAESLAEIVRLTSQANTRAREMSRGLVPVTLESAGLMSALQELAASTQKVFRVKCRFAPDGQVLVDDNMTAMQLYRIAQEAVGNALKHSRATQIDISLAKEGDNFRLQVRDNGVGIPDHAPGEGTGMGLLTMTHRAKMLGGRLSVTPGRPSGTLVNCEVPLYAPQLKPRSQP
jgi:PAS domain S-box-containing protein